MPTRSQSSPQIDFGPSMVDAAFQSVVSAILIIDETGLIHKVNSSCETMFGFPQAELVGQNVKMLMPEPDRSAHDSYLKNYFATGQKKIIGIGREVRGRRKDGALFPMHLSVGEFEAGGNRYFVGSINDISARVAAEAESARQKTLFEAIFDNCPDAMIILDAKDRIFLYNAAAKRIFGYNSKELIGQSGGAIFASEADGARIAEAAAHFKPGSLADPQTISFLRKDGWKFPGAMTAADILDGCQAHLGFLAVIRDISREVAQEQALRQAQRMEALGQLTGGIAHDFNNLLTIITGNLELLDLDLEGEEPRDLLKRANDAANMGARLTDRLLTFARRRRLNEVLINLNNHLLGTMDLLRRTLGETISLTSSLAPDLWPIRSDISEIENAVLNLAINARDAMPDGGELTIETANLAIDDDVLAGDLGLMPGGYVRLSVSDTGIGITPEVLARVFEPFFTTKEAGKGTGLGLSVIYGFAKQSGGRVTIYSEPGHGTTVNLYLPRAEADLSGRPERQETSSPQTASGETILVVEDQELVRDITRRRLQRLGYRVQEADSAVAAVELLQSGEAVDLIFSDIVMPGGMTGFDLADWAREHRPGIPVVLTSGFAQDLAESRSKDRPVMTVLRKPYSGEDLIAAIRAALDARPPRTE
jgi:PAS domain S-box-containing protein